MLFVNFKTYEHGTGQKAVELIRILFHVQEATNVPIIPVVQVVDARLCAGISSLDIWVQHVDSIEPGQQTGWILPEAVAATGVKGTFLNHSEHKISSTDHRLQTTVNRCRDVGLKTLVFASSLEELNDLTRIDPVTDFVSYEPPELIASKETSVAKSKSQDIKKAVEIAGNISLIVGAGIKEAQDIKTSLELGAKGVVVSSAVVLADNPKMITEKLVSGFR